MANEFVSFDKLKIFLENIKTKTISPIVKTLSNRISALEQRGGGGGGTQVNFVPRTNTSKAPEKGNKYWTNTAYGGLNPYQIESSEGSVLPNCVSYVYGRLLEINDQCHPETIWYPQLDGWKYYDTCKKNGIPVDPSIPKEGAIACWEDSTRSLGHVAMVESVSKDGNTYNINYTDSWSDHPEHSYYYGATSSDSGYYFSSGAWEFIGFVYAVELSETPIQDLAKVAYTGEYSDLLNLPVIPDEQINSDWNQTDPTKKDFIKNKPIIPPSATVDSALSTNSINPVQNKVITTRIISDEGEISGKINVSDKLTNSEIEEILNG